MPAISKRLMGKLLKKSKSTSVSTTYPWVCVRAKAEDTLFPEKLERARKMLENVIWDAPGFGPNAK